MARYVLVGPVINSFNDKQRGYSITDREKFNPICPSFVTHSVTHNKKWASKVGIYNAYIIAYTNKKLATVYTATHCTIWSQRAELNRRPTDYEFVGLYLYVLLNPYLILPTD